MAQRRTIRLLLIILVVILVAAAAIVWLLPASQPEPPAVTEDLVPVEGGPLFADDQAAPIGTTSSTGIFNLGVFERSSYNILNHQLINEGALPVQPPATTGKANPFL